MKADVKQGRSKDKHERNEKRVKGDALKMSTDIYRALQGVWEDPSEVLEGDQGIPQESSADIATALTQGAELKFYGCWMTFPEGGGKEEGRDCKGAQGSFLG